jgi:VIT1/CCC1 family predicted Fe2+/Mn2+ transporter
MTSNHHQNRVRGLLGIIGDLVFFGLAWIVWRDHQALGLRLAVLLLALGALLWSISWLVHGQARRWFGRISFTLLGAALVSFVVFRA